MVMRCVQFFFVGLWVLVFTQVGIKAENLVEVTATLIPVGDEAKVTGLSQLELKKELMSARARNHEKLLQLSVVVESGEWATVRRGREFWYPKVYSKAKVHKAVKDSGEYSVPEGQASTTNHTMVYPNSPLEMTSEDLGALLRVRPTIKQDGLIYLEGELRDVIFEGFTEEAIPITVKTKQLVKGSRSQEILVSRIDTPVFHRFKQNFGVMLPHSSGTSEAAKRLRQAQTQYDYLIPVELGNNIFGARGKIEFDTPEKGKAFSVRSAIGSSLVDKATMLKDRLIQKNPNQERKSALLLLEVKKIKPPISQPYSGQGSAQIFLTSKLVESSKPLALPGAILTDDEYQAVIREINKQKGLDILSAPSVVASSGQTCELKVIREFVFPTSFEPPENGNKVSEYANPVAFETRDTGVTLKAECEQRGDKIGLRLSSYITEFEGFVGYGNPVMRIKSGVVKKMKAAVESENGVEMPVFPFRASDTDLEIPNGSVVVFTTIFDQYNEEHHTNKLLRIGQPKVEEVISPRYLTVFIKGQLVDSRGKP